MLGKISNILKNKFNKKDDKMEIDYTLLPAHIAIIMDGNRRWAKRQGLPVSIGHRTGAQTLKKITEFADEIGIKILTVYAFSTENWKRTKKEVNTLMQLLLEYLKDAERQLAGKNVVIKVIGDIGGLSEEIQEQIIKTEKLTEKNTGLLLNIAINYGGRLEVVHAVKKITEELINENIKINDIDEELISKYMYTSGIQDPDLIIRPSGEYRLSNFLLWQSAYSEFWFSNIYWPDFNEKYFLKAIYDYQNRSRRYGGV